jgi:hypothetical protein
MTNYFDGLTIDNDDQIYDGGHFDDNICDDGHISDVDHH